MPSVLKSRSEEAEFSKNVQMETQQFLNNTDTSKLNDQVYRLLTGIANGSIKTKEWFDY